MQRFISLCLICLTLDSMSNAWSFDSKLFQKRRSGGDREACSRQRSCLRDINVMINDFVGAVLFGQPMDFSSEAVNNICDTAESVRNCLGQAGDCQDPNHPIQMYYDSLDYLCSDETVAIYEEINGVTCDVENVDFMRSYQSCVRDAGRGDGSCRGGRASYNCAASTLTTVCGPQVGQLAQGFFDIQLEYACQNDK